MASDALAFSSSIYQGDDQNINEETSAVVSTRETETKVAQTHSSSHALQVPVLLLQSHLRLSEVIFALATEEGEVTKQRQGRDRDERRRTRRRERSQFVLESFNFMPQDRINIPAPSILQFRSSLLEFRASIVLRVVQRDQTERRET